MNIDGQGAISMSVGEYGLYEKRLVERFVNWYVEMQRADPDKFPETMGVPEWDEQLMFYAESVDGQ